MMNKLLNVFAFILVVTLAGCGGEDNGNAVSESGTIEAENVVISAQAPGRIERLLKDDGDKVQKGDTLAIIEHKKLKQQVKQAEAAAEAARARLSLVNEGARSEDITAAETNFAQAEAAFKQAKTNFDRMKNLRESNSITEQRFEEAETNFEVAKARHAAAEANLEKVKNISRPEEKTQARANYNQAEAQLALLKEQLSDAYIISPVNGTVVNSFMNEGETAGMMSSLFKIADLSEVKLTIYIPEPKLGLVKTGQRAEIFTDSYKDKTYEGRVTLIADEAEFTPKNIQTKDERTKLVFAVEITAANPNRELKPGMPADAVIYLNDNGTTK